MNTWSVVFFENEREQVHVHLPDGGVEIKEVSHAKYPRGLYAGEFVYEGKPDWDGLRALAAEAARKVKFDIFPGYGIWASEKARLLEVMRL